MVGEDEIRYLGSGEMVGEDEIRYLGGGEVVGEDEIRYRRGGGKGVTGGRLRKQQGCYPDFATICM